MPFEICRMRHIDKNRGHANLTRALEERSRFPDVGLLARPACDKTYDKAHKNGKERNVVRVLG